MKHILFVTLTLSTGGAERVVSVLSSELCRRGHNVDVLLYKRVEEEYPVFKKLRIHTFDQPTAGSKMKRNIDRIANLRNKIQEIHPDVVIPFLAQPTQDVWLATRGLSIEFVATVRNNPSLYPRSKTARFLVNQITEHADAILFQTAEQETFFTDKARNKGHILGNPVKQDMLDAQYIYRGSIKNIVTCGRLNKQKNQSLLIRAFNQVHRSYPDISLQIYGSGDQLSALQHLINELSLEDSVQLMGRTEDVVSAYLNNDLFVLSSDYEGFPNALLEAMAVGIPCISTDCPTGPGDLIQHKHNGLLVGCGNVKDLAERICYAVENVNEMNELGRNAKNKIIENYTVKHIVDQLEEILLL